MFDHLLKVDISFFQQHSSSDLVTRMSYNANGVRDMLNLVSLNLGRDLFTIIGLVGTMITDGYECTASYVEPGHDVVTKVVKHAIYTTIGNASGPDGLKPMPIQQASTTALRQLVGKSLEELNQSTDIAQ